VYDVKISRKNPALIILLIDQSHSMNEQFFSAGGKTFTIAQIAKYVADRFLYEILSRCLKGNDIYDYVDTAIIGYGTSIKSALPKVGLDEFPIPSSYLPKIFIRRNEKNSSDEEFPLPRYEWVESVANGYTSMLSAFNKAKQIIEEWIPDHRDSFPPIVLNITDGMPTDDIELVERMQNNTLGEMETLNIFTTAKKIQEMRTDNGNVLICNAHVSPEKITQIEFPNNVDNIENPFAELMFVMSSVVPKELFELGREYRFNLSEGSRFFVFNAEAKTLLNFINFGSGASLKKVDDQSGNEKLGLPEK